MPKWFKEKMKQFAPKPTNLDDLQQDWQDLMDRLNLHQPAEKIKSNTSGSKPNLNANKTQSSNPAAKPGNSNQGVSNGAILVPAVAGKQKMIKNAPTPVVLEEHDIKGASVGPTFKYKAGEYAEDQNILFINATYPAVEMAQEYLLSDTGPISQEIESLAYNISVKLITDLVGKGLVYGLVKQGKPGYEDDFEKVIDSACLSTHADKWIEHIDLAKKRFEKESKIIDLTTNNLTNLENRLVAAGGLVPNKEAA
jgi:hypothetical protein